MTRGEAIKDMVDVYRIRAMALAEPNVIYWIPTRAWKSKHLKALDRDGTQAIEEHCTQCIYRPYNYV